MKQIKKFAKSKEIHTYIQINTTCNQKCIFCNRPPENSTKQVFKLKDIEKKIKKLSDNSNIKRIIFTGGEPLLYPQLAELISFAKKLNFTTEIQTNGTLLHTKILELKKAGLDIINFAFHSHIKDISNRLRGNESGFEDIIHNLKQANDMNFEIHIIHVINSLNYQFLPEFIDYINKLHLKKLFWLNLSLVVPEGWAWENKWIVPRVKDVKPFLLKAMKKCQEYNYKFDISEIVPLCLVNGFEDYAISTIFKLQNFEIIDDYLTGKRSLEFANPSDIYTAKAPQCQKCSLNNLCAGFYPNMKKIHGTDDYTPRQDNPLLLLEKLLKK